MKKLCCSFNTPSLYREAIYRCIENQYDCDWYFEDTNNHLKEFDTSQFHSVERLKAFSFGPFYAVRGFVKPLFKKEYTQFLVMGHSRNISLFAFLYLKKFFFPKKKVYLWTHGFYGKEGRIEHFLKKNMLSMADELLIYGDYACNIMKGIGFDEKKLHAIHNSLDYHTQIALRRDLLPSEIYKAHFDNDNPNLIFIGRLNSGKKLDMVVSAVASLKKQDMDLNLTFVGDGGERKKLESLAEELGIRDCVWFYGACYDERENAELIFNADLLVSPGNIGLSAIHALTFGCPAITHDNFAYQMPEFEAIKKGVTGDFFEFGNQVSLEKTISDWFHNHKNDRDKIRKMCYDEIDCNWNPDYQIRILNSIIES